MALTCNAFDGVSLTDSACLVAQKTEPANLGNSEIAIEKFLFLVVDMIEAIRLNPGTTPALSSIEMCEAAETLRRANCATQFVTFPYKPTIAQLQAIILQQLSETLCT